MIIFESKVELNDLDIIFTESLRGKVYSISYFGPKGKTHVDFSGFLTEVKIGIRDISEAYSEGQGVSFEFRVPGIYSHSTDFEMSHFDRYIGILVFGKDHYRKKIESELLERLLFFVSSVEAKVKQLKAGM